MSGYTTSPSSGTIIVNGANVNQAITFTATVQTTYTITFTENGLPTGSSWSVTLNGITKTSTNSTITFNEPNGTYSYTIVLPSGYNTTSSSGSVSTTQSITNIPVSVTSTSTTPSPSSSPTNYLLIVIVIVIVVIIAIVGGTFVMRRGKKKGGPKQWQEPTKEKSEEEKK